MDDKRIFIDTNILLTACHTSRHGYLSVVGFFENYPQMGYTFYISTQVLREYLVVATRPLEVNGLGLSVDRALANVDAFKERCVCLEEHRGQLKRLFNILSEFGISGKRIHDANLVACMQEQGISNLLTFNRDDFKCFSKFINLVKLPS